MQEFKKTHGSGTTTSIISNKEMNYIIKIVQALKDSNILLKGVTKTIKNEKKGVFLSMLLGNLEANLLGNMLAGKGIVTAGSGKRIGKGILRAGYRKKTGFLMPPHPLTNFEIQKYYPNEPTFNGVYFRNNLPKKIKDLAYVINLDDYADVDTHIRLLYVVVGIKLFITIVLVLNMFLKRLKTLSCIKS